MGDLTPKLPNCLGAGLCGGGRCTVGGSPFPSVTRRHPEPITRPWLAHDTKGRKFLNPGGGQP